MIDDDGLRCMKSDLIPAYCWCRDCRNLEDVEVFDLE